MHANIPANCINTNGLFAPGVHGVASRLSKARERANCKCARYDRESWFHRRGRGGYRGAINSDKLYYPRYILSRMKSSGPCLPSSPAGHPTRSVSSFPSCRYRRFGVPLWICAPPVIAGEGDMRLVLPERKRCHFLPAVFLAPANRPLPSPFFPSSRVLALLILSLGINPLLYILRTYFRFSYCDRRALPPDRSDPLSPHLHAVMHPLLVFPALSSALIPTCSIGWFHRFSPIEIDACLFPFTTRVPFTTTSLQLPRPPSSFLPNPFFRSSFSTRLSPDMCLIFGIAVNFRPLAPVLVCICVSILRPFFPALLYPVCHPTPTTLSWQSACCRHVLRHIYPSLCINFSSLSFFQPTINTLSRSVYYIFGYLQD